MANPVRLAVLISGSGRSLANFAQKIAKGKLDATIRIVIATRADAAGVERAREAGLRTVIVRRKSFGSVEAFSEVVTEELGRAGVDLVAMAGFLSLYRIPPQYTLKVMNIHPALLPKFGGTGMFGHKVHEAVLAAGEKESGCTVHFADNRYDHGPIILQRKVKVLKSDTVDTLAARVFEQELIAYPEAINLFAAGKLRVVGDKVNIL